MKQTTKPLTVCFFGTYDRNYSRNQVLINGLEEIGVPINEVHVALAQTEFYAKKHMGPEQILRRILRKASFFPVVLSKLGMIKAADVILVAYPGHLDLPLGWLMGKVFGKPVLFDPTFSLYQILTSDFKAVKNTSLFARLIKIYEKIIFSLPQVVLADSQYQKQYYIDTLSIKPEKIRLLPFGANNKLYPHVGYPEKKSARFIVVYYGLFNPIHGVEHILESARLTKSDKNIEYLLIGSGQTYTEMHEKARKLKLTNVTFHPKIMEKDALGYLSQADVFLGFFQNSPTVLRSIPNKVLQGLALGKAVITARTPVAEDVFSHKKDIYLCNIADGASLSEAILDLKKHPQLKLAIAAAGHKLFSQRFTPQAIAKTFMSISENVQSRQV